MASRERKTIQERFAAFDADHPEFYAEFQKIIYQLRDERGQVHYSADAIFHIIRFHRVLDMRDKEPFKISNDFISRYVRKACEEDPSLTVFFTLRELRSA